MQSSWLEGDPWLRSVAIAVERAIAPQAAQLDRDPGALRKGFQWLGEQGWLHLHGGVGDQPVTNLQAGQFREVLARYSGALAFLQVQHQSAGAMIATSSNEALREAYLPGLATGDRAIGIGFSHLRRRTPPVTAQPVLGGYRVTGLIPWATGWGCFRELVGAAVLEDGQSVFGLMPFQTQPDSRLRVGEPMELAAFRATQTVAIELDDYFLPEERVLHVRSPNWIAQNDRQKILSASFFALGCTQGSLDVLNQCLAWRQGLEAELAESIQAIATELDQCRAAVHGHYRNNRRNNQLGRGDGMGREEQLSWRGRAIALALNAAQTALMASGGAANHRDHPAQRLSREAMVFGVAGQTSDVLRTTLQAQRISPR